MAKFNVATNTPPKPELIAAWVRKQPWSPSTDASFNVVGSIHLEDPEGQVGMQVYLLESEGSLFQVPVTYRDEPLSKTPESLIGTIEHSVLGLRYVHDGIYDDQFVTVLAGVASAGYGQSLGFAQQDGRWHAWPDQLRLEGTAELPGRPPVDRFAILNDNNDHVALQNDHIEMTIYRRLTQETQPNHGLLTTLPDRDAPTTLVEIRSLQPSE